jgi:hypothetical protein
MLYELIEIQAMRANGTVYLARMARRTKRNTKARILGKGKEGKATGQTALSALLANNKQGLKG